MKNQTNNMRADLVFIRTELVERFRKRRVVGKEGLYSLLGVHARTGKRILEGRSVNLNTAQKVAIALGLKVQNIITSWVEIDGDANGDTNNGKKQ